MTAGQIRAALEGCCDVLAPLPDPATLGALRAQVARLEQAAGPAPNEAELQAARSDLQRAENEAAEALEYRRRLGRALQGFDAAMAAGEPLAAARHALLRRLRIAP